MAYLLRAYKVLNLLSIDVAVGALIGALFFADMLHVALWPYGMTTLVLTVWIVYSLDHLRDARQIKGKASGERHAFHQRYFTIIAFFVLMSITVDAILIFFIKRPVLKFGLLLSGFVLIYLLFHRKLYFLKEVFVALLYTLGVLLPSLAVTVLPVDSVIVLSIMQYFLLALLNLLIFSWFDQHHDTHDQLPSFISFTGDKLARLIITITFSIFFILNLYQLFVYESIGISAILFLMGIVLMIIWLKPEYFRINDRFRLLGDAIFFLPVLNAFWS